MLANPSLAAYLCLEDYTPLPIKLPRAAATAAPRPRPRRSRHRPPPARPQRAPDPRALAAAARDSGRCALAESTTTRVRFEPLPRSCFVAVSSVADCAEVAHEVVKRARVASVRTRVLTARKGAARGSNRGGRAFAGRGRDRDAREGKTRTLAWALPTAVWSPMSTLHGHARAARSGLSARTIRPSAASTREPAQPRVSSPDVRNRRTRADR